MECRGDYEDINSVYLSTTRKTKNANEPLSAILILTLPAESAIAKEFPILRKRNYDWFSCKVGNAVGKDVRYKCRNREW